MDENEFKRRTKQFGLRVIKLAAVLPREMAAQVIGKQLLRTAISVGSNYRAACRGKSVTDVINKLGIVEEEADESVYWLEMLIEAGLMPETRLKDLLREANEIVAMTVASIKTLRRGAVCQSKIQNPKSKIAQ
ncbi:MAG: four helix bundle protein [Verrucomicrobiia bacterium]